MISIIVTVYNKLPFLKRCLNSLVAQTDKTAQIILVDDGSTDGSSEICDNYAKKYDWEIYHQNNKGVSAARNFGLSKVKNNYVTFLDADDAFTEDAIEIMSKMAEHDFDIVQFGQFRCHTGKEPVKRCATKGYYAFNNLPRFWRMVWNKMYKTSLIKAHKIKFKEGLQFCEDELFNIECLLIADKLYHAPQTLMRHYFDDHDSLCRGGLSLERFEQVDDALSELIKGLKETDIDKSKIQWVKQVQSRHRHSELFQAKGFSRGLSGKYDIIYFVKDAEENEELRYSLRSVEANFKYHNVWFYGGCPKKIMPDRHVEATQTEPSKWERVRSMMQKACENDEITEDFWLFNDDFFVLKPIPENMPPQYNGTLYELIVNVEERHGQASTRWTKRIRHLVKTLKKAKKGYLNYAVHKPILINRKKMLEVLEKFPDEPMMRALYGNYWEIGGVSQHDMKIQKIDYAHLDRVKNWEFVSTEDESFSEGNVGQFIRERFNKPSRFEEQ